MHSTTTTTAPLPATTPVAPAQPQVRSRYPVFRSITTRWGDNDVYGHVNNVVYYSWFDTAVNAYLMEQGALDIHAGEAIGLVVETGCNYFAPLAFPQTIDAGASGRAVVNLKQTTDLHTSTLSQLMTYEYLKTGRLANQIKMIREAYRQKYQAFAT